MSRSNQHHCYPLLTSQELLLIVNYYCLYWIWRIYYTVTKLSSPQTTHIRRRNSGKLIFLPRAIPDVEVVTWQFSKIYPFKLLKPHFINCMMFILGVLDLQRPVSLFSDVIPTSVRRLCTLKDAVLWYHDIQKRTVECLKLTGKQGGLVLALCNSVPAMTLHT